MAWLITILVGFCPAFARVEGAPPDPSSVDYLFREVKEPITEDFLVRHVFAVLDERTGVPHGPLALVHGRVILNLAGEGLANVDRDRVIREVRRVLVGGETLDEYHYVLEPEGWLGLSFEEASPLRDAVGESLTQADLWRACDAVLTPARPN